MENKILNAAYNIFTHKGYHATTMDEIAHLAGVNKASLFYYFRSKNKLYTIVFEEVTP
ncbi:helix-turn-helix domain-containing protein [uncultured Draconibacterium sp.]|uniref:TetR/AcrR family transcriptional regulator n=1 Tax=uncultured Draconibacterium sp. TaxID=1573823 RepID=UPI0032174525